MQNTIITTKIAGAKGSKEIYHVTFQKMSSNSKQALEEMTVKQLQSLLRQKNFPVSGRKSASSILLGTAWCVDASEETVDGSRVEEEVEGEGLEEAAEIDTSSDFFSAFKLICRTFNTVLGKKRRKRVVGSMP
jgi:hypothetical protein